MTRNQGEWPMWAKIMLMIVCFPGPTFILICLIAFTCEGIQESVNPTDPIDTYGPQRYYSTTTMHISDTLGNYFHVTYNSTNCVSEERAEEIGLRDNVFASRDSLQAEASRIYPDFTNVDIYDFGKLALKYSTEPDHKIERIRGDGNTFWKIYKRPSYDICVVDGGDTIVDCSNRGMPYIMGDDLMGYLEKKEPKKYRYFNSVLHYYDTDEKKTHCNTPLKRF